MLCLHFPRFRSFPRCYVSISPGLGPFPRCNVSISLGNSSSTLPEKVLDRLEQLDEMEDGPNLSNLTQAEYSRKIEEMGKVTPILRSDGSLPFVNKRLARIIE